MYIQESCIHAVVRVLHSNAFIYHVHALQVESSRIYVKYAVRLHSIDSIPYHVEKVHVCVILLLLHVHVW